MKNQTAPIRGVYFLANDKVEEPVIAFLNSFRAHNPTIRLCLIPYDNAFSKILDLQEEYEFSVFQDVEKLAACDEISLKFHNKRVGAYRKLVAWEGEFDEFAYIDIDTIVLSSIDFTFKNLNHCDVFTSHSDMAEIRQFVWKKVPPKSMLSDRQINFSANTGFFVSRRGLLNLSYVESKVHAGLDLKDFMELDCMEQPFLNFLIVTSGFRYGSLWTFFCTGLDKEAKFEWWAGNPGAKVDLGQFTAPSSRPIFLVHWAGPWLSNNGSVEEIPYKELWKYYRYQERLTRS